MSQLGASSSEASPGASANLSKNNCKSYSCVLCAQRKVRCDRNPGGCANCTKARVNCIYKPPPPPRRRKKGDRDVDTTVRLRIYEDALRQLQVDPEAIVKQALSTGTAYGAGTALKPFFPSLTGEARHESHVKPEAGVLVTDEGRSRYLENGIWTSLQSEFRAARDILEDSSDDDSTEPEDGLRIGLHRDPVKLGLMPFDVEMRRRLWWQIMMLEGYAQKLAGTGTAGTILMGDVNMPANVNDSDLFIGMKEPPPEHEGASEMMFFLIRCHVGEFLKRSADTHTTFDGVWNKLTTSAVHVAIKDKAITELEALFEQKFLQYCDPSIPWHLMCSQLGKAIIFMMRFMAHSTEYYKMDMRQDEKDLLFDLALQVIAAQNLAYTMKEMQGFMWHVNLHFQWKAFVYLLSELRYRFEGPVVDKAWEEVAKAHDFHPSFDKELALRALPVAVSNLTLKAWDAYISHRGVPPLGEPYFIQVIRHRQSHPKASKEAAHLSATTTPDISTEIFHSKGRLVDSHIVPSTDPLQAPEWNAADFNTSLGATSNLVETLPLDRPESLDWATWDNLLVDFQTAATEDMPIDLSAFNFGLKNGDYSDLVITCGTDTYNVHRMIVCARADVFSRAVGFGGKETDEGKIDLPDDEPDTVALLMQYLYEGEYEPRLPSESVTNHAESSNMSLREVVRTISSHPDGYNYLYTFPHTCSDCRSYPNERFICPHHQCGNECEWNCNLFTCNKCTRIKVHGPADQLLLHSKMYEIADKYDVKGLKDLARVKFEGSCATFWDDSLFSAAAHHAFSTTMEDDKGLRDVVSGTISKHMELIRKPEVQALMTEFNGLSMSILLKKADEHGWGVK
ncbi:hypothetical protein FB567DRAFT_558421 [Paraphoma chrysanthemicola]|uniref:Zn(2)-C6 fungal-type domain-containing protein n=1 Tax=Paraphoma chrysanthemicola TaxID=798071 RepID=A0A8K0REW4_9PLEO|nr:hypothetical protein FB567DRAFT_558421 [Paraphoma chrysanthemicola]